MANERTQIASIFQQVLQHMTDENFEAIDKMLEETEPSAMEVSVTLALLAITVRCAPALKKREAYFAKMQAHLEAARPAEEVKVLLRGLK